MSASAHLFLIPYSIFFTFPDDLAGLAVNKIGILDKFS